jgi:hypothetical protein
MKTMTLNIGDKEMEYLERISAEKEITKTAIMRQALRYYQLFEEGVPPPMRKK